MAEFMVQLVGSVNYLVDGVQETWTWLWSGENFKNFAAPLLSPALVIIGWRVISRDNDRRETRKETRALINDFVKRVDEFQKDTIKYFDFEVKGTATTQEIELKRSLERLELMLGYLNRIDSSFQGQLELTALSDLVTGHSNFESATKVVVPTTDQLHLKIALACSALVKQIEFQFIEVLVKK